MTNNAISAGTRAREHDVVTIHVEAPEPIHILQPATVITVGNARVGESRLSLDGDGEHTYSISFVVEAAENGPVRFLVHYRDVAGHEGTPVDTTIDGSSVEVDTTAPILTAVSIVPSDTPVGVGT